jgi:hypothetical protein
MNEVVVQDNRYPEWMKAWNAKIAELDHELIDYVGETSAQTVDALEEIVHKVVAWWDRQHMSAEARSEYEREKASERAAIRARVENRVEFLEKEGRIRRTKQIAADGGEY